MMQILELVLFGKDGKRRVVPFSEGKVNIITGKSATGKSSIVQIIDYCLGSSKCDVPEGVIREKVTWFGLLLKMGEGKVFIARENPPLSAQSTNRAYFLEGSNIESPTEIAKPNTTIEAIEEALSGKIGINENLHIPGPGQTRKPSSASVRQGLYYCFQDQDVIASKNVLFHRQAEPFLPQSMKDTLPYLLGAVNEDHLMNLQELNKAKRHLASLQRELQDSESVKGTSTGKGLALVSEAKSLGMLPANQEVENIEEAHEILKGVVIKDHSSAELNKLQDSGKDYLTLQNELYELENNLQHVEEKINTAKHFATGASGFQGEAEEQMLRLQSIGIFKGRKKLDLCPICHSKSDAEKIEKDITQSIDRLRKELETVTKEQPKINEYVTKLEKQREDNSTKFRKKQREIEGVLASQAAMRTYHDRNLRIGMTLGRISLWLDSVNLTADDTTLKKQVEKWDKEVKRLEKLVDPSEVEERLSSIISRISDQMTKESDLLKLEHSGNPVRFDLKDLTVVVDMEDRPVPLKRIGSGENHVGYHLLALTALHGHFIKNSRPVPRFLVLDQPSQVYYPPEKQDDKGSFDLVGDEDKQALDRMYKFVFNFVNKHKGNFQVILLDHANPDDKEFRSYIVEEWRDGEALIPLDWL